MKRQCPVLALIVPCYNEEKTLPYTISLLVQTLEQLVAERVVDAKSRIVFVDDGSKDTTWQLIEQQASVVVCVQGIKLSFNAGHQNALMAGMMEQREQVDCIISIDADLQHDVSIVPEMLRRFSQGDDIVTGVRLSRTGDSRWKKLLSDGFYRIMKKLGTPLDEQYADFRLMGRNVLDALSCYPERNLFLRGIIASMGFQASAIPYDQRERQFGESKYSFGKMLALALNGITSFSSIPLRFSAVLGGGTLILAFIFSISTFVDYCRGETVAGWPSLMLTMLFLGAIQLFCISILGEYTAKIYIEVKRRPHYIVEKATSLNEINDKTR